VSCVEQLVAVLVCLVWLSPACFLAERVSTSSGMSSLKGGVSQLAGGGVGMLLVLAMADLLR
jgi:hypothetical protein